MTVQMSVYSILLSFTIAPQFQKTFNTETYVIILKCLEDKANVSSIYVCPKWPLYPRVCLKLWIIGIKR